MWIVYEYVEFYLCYPFYSYQTTERKGCVSVWPKTMVDDLWFDTERWCNLNVRKNSYTTREFKNKVPFDSSNAKELHVLNICHTTFNNLILKKVLLWNCP